MQSFATPPPKLKKKGKEKKKQKEKERTPIVLYRNGLNRLMQVPHCSGFENQHPVVKHIYQSVPEV